MEEKILKTPKLPLDRRWGEYCKICAFFARARTSFNKSLLIRENRMKTITAYIDESGTKQKAETEVADPKAFGVAVALILPEGTEEQFFTLLKEKMPNPPTDKTHVTDLESNQEAYRTAVYDAIKGLPEKAMVVYEVISATGYHKAEYEQFKLQFENFKRERKMSDIRPKIRQDNPNAQVELLEGIVLKARAAVTDRYGEKDVKVRCVADKIDKPLYAALKENLEAFDADEHKETVKGFNVKTGQELVGTICSKLSEGVDAKLCEWEVQLGPKSDMGIFAADIIVNSLYHHLKSYVADNGCVSVNRSKKAVAGYQLEQYLVAGNSDMGICDYSDLVYNN